MMNLGMPVPFGFTVTTEACNQYLSLIHILRMYGTVSSFYGTLLLIQISPVIVIQIMKKAGSCGAAGIQMESPCYQKSIIRDIQRVLKS